jgi:hypothetical protein
MKEFHDRAACGSPWEVPVSVRKLCFSIIYESFLMRDFMRSGVLM